MDKKQFQAVNLHRSDTVFNCAGKSNLYWAVAIAEEAGEVAGVIKKSDRGMNEREFNKTRERLLRDLQGISMMDAPIPLVEDLSINQIKSAKFLPRPEEPTKATHFIIDYWKAAERAKLSSELADLYIYMDILCQKNGINLEEAVKSKFNQVSLEMGYPELQVI